ncbi:MAG: hypothetical protein ACUVRD_06800 [Bacteroidia bacterium]
MNWNFWGFFSLLPPRQKKGLVVAYALLAAATFGAAFFLLKRNDYADLYYPLAFWEEEEIPIQKVTQFFRTLTESLPVGLGFFSVSATLLFPPKIVLLIATVLTFLGWAILFAHLPNYGHLLGYGVYFLWVFWISQSDLAENIFTQDPWYLGSLGLSLVAIVPGYLFQNGFFRSTFYGRLGVFVGILGMLASLAYVGDSWGGLHSLTIKPFLGGFLFSVIGAFFGVWALATIALYPVEAYRLGMGGLLFWSGLMGLGAATLLFAPQEISYLLGIGLFLAGWLAGMWGLQVYYPLTSENFPRPATFLWIWLAMGLIAVSALTYHVAAREYIYFYRIGILSRSLYAFGFLAFVLYVAANFFLLFRQKVPFYWDLHRGPRFGTATVFFLMVLGTVFLEARASWPTIKIWARIQGNLQADYALFKNDLQKAQDHYKETLLIVESDPKANFNYGRLTTQSSLHVEATHTLYLKAFSVHPFEPAALMDAHFLGASQRYVRAIGTLQTYTGKHGPTWPIATALGYYFEKVNQLDSAVHYLKKAIALAPTEPQTYANLARIYYRYGKKSWAQKVIREAVPHLSAENPAWANVIFFRFAFSDSLLPPPPMTQNPIIYQNARWLRSHDTTLLGRFLGALQQDSLRSALELFPALKQDETYHILAARRLGFYYLAHQVPEMAKYYFEQAQTPQDSLYAAYMLIDAGGLEMGYQALSRLRIEYPAFRDAIRRELALLHRAYNEYTQALLEWNFQDITPQERLRLARFCEMKNNLPGAVEALADWVQTDKSYAEPYAIVGRLFRNQKDYPTALENFFEGLKYHPQSPLLWREVAVTYADQKQFDRADSIWKALEKDTEAETHYLRARFYAGRGDTLQAQKAIDKALACNFLYVPALLLKAQLHPAQAYRILFEALDYNTQNPLLWEAYAQAAYREGLVEEAQAALQKAQNLQWK